MWWSPMLDWLNDGVEHPGVQHKKTSGVDSRRRRAYRGREKRWYRRWVAPFLPDLMRKARLLRKHLFRRAIAWVCHRIACSRSRTSQC